MPTPYLEARDVEWPVCSACYFVLIYFAAYDLPSTPCRSLALSGRACRALEWVGRPMDFELAFVGQWHGLPSPGVRGVRTLGNGVLLSVCTAKRERAERSSEYVEFCVRSLRPPRASGSCVIRETTPDGLSVV